MADPADSDLSFTRRVLIVAAVATAILVSGLLIWYLAQVLVLVFASVLLAILLEGLSRPLQLYLAVPRPLAVIVVTVVLVALLGLGLWTGGPMVLAQVVQLIDRLPDALSRAEALIREYQWGRLLLERGGATIQYIPEPADILGQVTGVFSTALAAVINTSLIFIIGFYLALDPRPYHSGVLRLIPLAQRDRAERAWNAAAHALRWWLVGRVAAMAAVGVLTAAGLWIIEVPLPLALGLIAGLLSFVPYLGPVISAVPAVLIALIEGPWLAFNVVVVFAVVQFLEGNFITPLIQVRAVHLPPAALLVAQVLMGVLFGLSGVLVATPLVVAVIVLVQMLYIRDVLGDREVEVLGEHNHRQA